MCDKTNDTIEVQASEFQKCTQIGGTANALNLSGRYLLHLLLFITRRYTIINANLKLINAKIHSFYSIDVH